MMSDQQNQNLPKRSKPQQKGSDADAKPFSMREYVFACRQKNIRTNWPFGEKYLQWCIKEYGIKNVLPPMAGITSHAETPEGSSNNLVQSQNGSNDTFTGEVPHLADDNPQSIANGCGNKVTNNTPSNEEGSQHNSLITSAILSQPAADTSTVLSSTHVHKRSSVPSSPKAVKGKRGMRKGICKKRSMDDILTVARHTTSEEMEGIYEFSYADDVELEDDSEDSCGN